MARIKHLAVNNFWEFPKIMPVFYVESAFQG